MPKPEFNTALRSLRGQLDAWVYKQTRHGPVVARRPDMSQVKWSPAQVAHRQKVRAAGVFYREVLADPPRLRRYQALARERGIPLSAVTLGEYLKGPPTP